MAADAQVPFRPVDASDHLGAFLVNGALGAVVGAVHAWTGEAPVGKGAVLGFLGGTLAHGARRIASADVPLSGLLARQVGSAASLLTTDGATGEFSLDRVPLRFGSLAWRVRDGTVTVDAGASAVTVYGMLSDRYDFRWWDTVSTGVAVFRTDEPLEVEDYSANGGYLPGNLVLESGAPDHTRPHELVHALQHDYLSGTVVIPLERAVIGDRLGWGAGPIRVRLRLFDLGLAAATSVWWTGDWRRNPLEFEARLLAEG